MRRDCLSCLYGVGLRVGERVGLRNDHTVRSRQLARCDEGVGNGLQPGKSRGLQGSVAIEAE